MRRTIATLLLALTVPALAQAPVRVLTHSSFDLPEQLLEQFTAETGWPVELLAGGDAGEVVNRAVLTAGRPLADVLFGVDASLLIRAADASVFEPYESPLLVNVPEQFHLSESHLVTPVDVGYVAFNLDLEWFAAHGLELPGSLEDLAEPAWADLTVVMDPAASSPGLAFMLATIQYFGDDWPDWWARLRDNGLQVTSGWTEAYYSAFSRYGGDRPIVLSYASSPAAEVIFAETELLTAPTGNLLCDGCTVRQVEGAGVLAGAANPEGARAFIDFLLSEDVQNAIPMSMFVYPVVSTATLPEEFLLFAEVPAGAGAGPAPALVSEHQADWLLAWTRVVLQGADPASVR